MSEALLEGNGVALVRERQLAAAVQGSLERVYGIDRTAEVEAFLQSSDGDREQVFVRLADDGAVEIAVRVPSLQKDASHDTFDPLCQLIEGVSHFVYLTECARTERTTTQLELELQAEVDKYLILASAIEELTETKSSRLRMRLFEDVRFAHEASTLEGDRYRQANTMAHRFVRYVEQAYLVERRIAECRTKLRSFFHAGQEEKLRVARGV
jgi:hypothetical protein